MNSLSKYIIEKLKLDKNIKVSEKVNYGDKVLVLDYLIGDIQVVLKEATIKSIFRNTIVLKYEDSGTGVDTMFVLEEGKQYLGKSKSGDLVFDKENALRLLNDYKEGDEYFFDDGELKAKLFKYPNSDKVIKAKKDFFEKD